MFFHNDDAVPGGDCPPNYDFALPRFLEDFYPKHFLKNGVEYHFYEADKGVSALRINPSEGIIMEILTNHNMPKAYNKFLLYDYTKNFSNTWFVSPLPPGVVKNLYNTLPDILIDVYNKMADDFNEAMESNKKEAAEWLKQEEERKAMELRNEVLKLLSRVPKDLAKPAKNNMDKTPADPVVIDYREIEHGLSRRQIEDVLRRNKK